MKALKNILHIVFLFALIVIILFPIFWAVLSSFKREVDMFATPPTIFFVPTIEHYINIFKEGAFLYLGNSLIITILTSALAVSFGTLGGYAFGRYNFRGKSNLFFWTITNQFMIPIVLIVPYFFILSSIGAINTYWSLILIEQTFTMPIDIWLISGQIAIIPTSIFEASKIDGLSELGMFSKIALPLSLPSIAAAFLIDFIFSWNNLVYPMLLTTRMNLRTLPIMSVTYLGGYLIPWGSILATSTFTILPISIIAVITSKYIVRGMTLGAIK